MRADNINLLQTTKASHRQANRRPFSWRTLDRQLPAIQVQDLMCNGQAKTQALLFIPAALKLSKGAKAYGHKADRVPTAVAVGTALLDTY